MLPFKKISIDDEAAFDSIVKPVNSLLCSHCFTDLFIWQSAYNTQICFVNNFAYIKQNLNDETIYTFPLGIGDINQALKLIIDDAKKRDVPLHIAAITPEQKKLISDDLKEKFIFNERPDNEDYIYLSQNLKTLSGKKLHSKRNFINRFKSEYEGRYLYEPITQDNIKEVFEYHLSWCSINNYDQLPDFFYETCAISLALKNFEALHLYGGMLKIDGKVHAFTLGSEPNDKIFIVHIEKADHDIPGCYQMINNLFAVNTFDDDILINREEDLGLEGLRKAKQSYNPVMMGINYSAKIKE